MPNTKRDNGNKILTSEKRDKLDAISEMLKGLKIKDSGYHEPESENANDTKGDPASNSNTATHDRNKRKVTDTKNGDLQQTLLSYRTLLITTTMIDPRIYDRFATCEASLYKLTMPQTTEVIISRGLSRILGA